MSRGLLLIENEDVMRSICWFGLGPVLLLLGPKGTTKQQQQQPKGKSVNCAVEEKSNSFSFKSSPRLTVVVVVQGTIKK